MFFSLAQRVPTFSVPVRIVTVRPWHLVREGSEEVKLGPGYDNIVIDTDQSGANNHCHAHTWRKKIKGGGGGGKRDQKTCKFILKIH